MGPKKTQRGREHLDLSGGLHLFEVQREGEALDQWNALAETEMRPEPHTMSGWGPELELTPSHCHGWRPPHLSNDH